MESGMGRPRRSRRHRQILQGPECGLDHQNRRAILYRPWIFVAAAKFLGEIGFVSIAAGLEAQEKHPRFLLACRSRKRHPLPAKHRAKWAMVFHCAPRAGARLLFQGLHATRGALLIATRRRPWIS